MIDAHCHLDAEGLPVSADEAIAEAAAVGVSGIVMAGVDAAGWAAQQAIATRHPGRVFSVFGVHPQVVAELSERALDAELAALETAVRDARRGGMVAPVALGEIGLDLLTPERKAQFLLSNAVNVDDYAGAVEAVRAMGLDPDAIPHYKPSAV